MRGYEIFNISVCVRHFVLCLSVKSTVLVIKYGINLCFSETFVKLPLSRQNSLIVENTSVQPGINNEA